MRRHSPPGPARVARAGDFDDVLWLGSRDPDVVPSGPLRGATSTGAPSLPWYGDPAELTPTERAALLTLAFVRGEAFTTPVLAEWLGMKTQGARRMLYALSRVVPLAQTGDYWHMAREADAEGDPAVFEI